MRDITNQKELEHEVLVLVTNASSDNPVTVQQMVDAIGDRWVSDGELYKQTAVACSQLTMKHKHLHRRGVGERRYGYWLDFSATNPNYGKKRLTNKPEPNTADEVVEEIDAPTEKPYPRSMLLFQQTAPETTLPWWLAECYATSDGPRMRLLAPHATEDEARAEMARREEILRPCS